MYICDVIQNNKREGVLGCVCLCVCKHSCMASFVLLFPTMCEYCPPTNRCDHVRPVARGGFEGFNPLGGWVGEGRREREGEKNFSLPVLMRTPPKVSQSGSSHVQF